MKTQNYSSKCKTILNESFKFLVVALSFTFCTLSLSKVEASEFSLAIYPPLLKIQAEPPADINAPIIIQNLSENNVSLDIVIKPFTETNEKGNFFFDKIRIVEENNPIESLSLAPQQKKDLFIKIHIDKEIPQKDYYFYIQFVSKESKIDRDTSYSQILGAISLNVMLSLGKEDPKVILEEFSSAVFVDRSSVPFLVKIKNKGKHFITPYGVITIKNIFGQKVKQIELPPTNILNESTKSIKLEWNKSFILGLYTAVLELSISKHAPVLSSSLSFFVLPVSPILSAIMLALFLILILIRVKKIVNK